MTTTSLRGPGSPVATRPPASGVDDTRVAITQAGQRIGVGDRIATRRNDRDLGVANRDTWTVVAVGHDGGLAVLADVTLTDAIPAGVTPTRAGERVLPVGYVTSHVELAYASTAHGAQGDTVPTGHLVVGEHTGAAAAYVGMTRGRTANTAHLVAADLAEAREQWIAVFGRPHLPDLPSELEHLARVAVRFDDRSALWRSFDTTAHRAVEEAHPEHARLHAAAEAACQAGEQAHAALAEARRRRSERLASLGPLAWAADPAGRLADFERYVATARHELAAAQVRIADLRVDPVLLGQPPDRLTAERDAWRDRYDAEQHQRRAVTPGTAATPAGVPRPESEHRGPSVASGAAPGFGR